MRLPARTSFPLRCVVAALGGLLYALAFPPLGWGWLVVPGVLGLLLALDGQRGTRARTLGFLHGLAAFATSLSWLQALFGGLAVLLFCILAAFTALFAEMQARAGARGISGWRFAAFTAVNWAGWEFIRAELFPLKFPWMTPGLAIGPHPILPAVGVYGMGAIVIFLVALLACGKWRHALGGLVVLTIGTLSWGRPGFPPGNGERDVKVAGLQFEGVSLTDLLAATRALPADVRHVAWPEYAVPYDLRKSPRDWKLIVDLCRERDLTLTFGTRLDEAVGEGWRNIALTADATGELGWHNKIHTVHLFDDGIPGKIALPVPTSHGPVGTPVCFDCDYEGVVRKMTAAGAEIFVVPIMDAEKWTAREHDQHAALFRIRACENGRWLLVCGSSGVSQIIDPRGGVQASLPAMAQGPVVGSMRRETGLTFYTRAGWLTPWCLLAAAVIGWVAMLVPGRWRGRTGGGEEQPEG